MRGETQSPEGTEKSKLRAIGGETARRALNSELKLPEDQLARGRYHIHLREPGAYEWFDEKKPGRARLFPFRSDLRETTREKAAEAIARTLKPRGATSQEI